MILKLYKRDGESILYWEAWDHGHRITIHHGRLGDLGETSQHEQAGIEKPDDIINREATALRRDGYTEISIEDHVQLIVQYRIADWGTSLDLDKRYRVENIVNECLGWTGNGHCDGGDIGSGTINVFSFVVDPFLASEAIIEALREYGLLNGAVIATEIEDGFRVLWTEDYEDEFNYFYSD